MAPADSPGPSHERQARLFALLYSPEEVEERFRRIYRELLSQSPHVKTGNFTRLGTDDLERLFAGYDREFFRGRLAEMLLEDEAHPMSFRLSRRLVSAAGQTMRWTRPIHRAGKPATKFEYEITVSTTLLFNTFQHLERRVTVGGLECRDRLEALQRIFEHELLHLAEFLGWGRSNCRARELPRSSRDGSSPTRGRTTTSSPPASRPAWPSASSSVTWSASNTRACAASAASTGLPDAPPSWSRIQAARSTPTAGVTFVSMCRWSCCAKSRTYLGRKIATAGQGLAGGLSMASRAAINGVRFVETVAQRTSRSTS